MKILLTGCTSRQANPEARSNKHDMSFGLLFAEALRAAGHEVEHRNPSIVEDLSDFDHVFVGLFPLHGLGANRAYGALAAILRTWGSGKLTLWTDDPEIGKTTGGIRTMTTDPNRLTKPFFAYRLEYDIAQEPAYADWLKQGVKILNDNPWPRLVVPHFAWSDCTQHYHKFAPQADGNVVPLDLTSFLPYEPVELGEERERRWVSELYGDLKWLNQQRLESPMARLGRKGSEKRPADPELFERYTKSWGVVQAPFITPGAWHTRLGMASAAGAAYVSRWQDMAPLGDFYTTLSETIDHMLPSERDEFVQGQRDVLAKATPNRDQIAETLNSFLKTEVPA